MENLLVQLIGWRATILHGDPTVYDRWKWLKDNLESGNKRTLDAGCGTGAFTLYAAKVGNSAVGISFNSRNMEIAQQRAKLLGLNNISFIQGDLRSFELISKDLGNFDQILCFETIEHLVDDQKLVKDLSRHLKPGGRLLLTTPFKGHHPVLGESQDPNYISKVEDGGHVRFGYTEEELQTLIEAAGMRVEKVDYVSGYLSQRLYNLWCRLDGFIPHKLTWLLTLPLRFSVLLDGPVTRMLRYPGFSIAVVARKLYP